MKKIVLILLLIFSTVGVNANYAQAVDCDVDGLCMTGGYCEESCICLCGVALICIYMNCGGETEKCCQGMDPGACIGEC
jgi:hypothetical protein